MDPNAAWKELLFAVRRDDRAEAREYAEALRDWTAKGGFRPDGVCRRDFELKLSEVLDPYGDVRDGVK